MKITVFGIVQGVGFRPTVYRVAKAMGLKGFVLNNGSNVEIHVDRDADVFLKKLKEGLSGVHFLAWPPEWIGDRDLLRVEFHHGPYPSISATESSTQVGR